MSTPRGAAGRIAAAFIDSPLTPLFLVAAIGLGIAAVLALPREEEPQIIVPMIDVFVQMPGASPAEVEQRVTRPLEKLLWEVPGVEYLYSTSSPGLALVVVRFYVGEAEASWFGGGPGVYVMYPDTRSGEEVAMMRVVPREEGATTS